MNRPLRAVTVFCGSSTGTDPAHRAGAVALGEVLVTRGIDLVYGGGSVGLMGVVADTVLAGGRRVTGVIPRHLYEKEVGHDGLTDLLIVESMHERKLAMADRADAFVALPGGIGTFEELFEVLTWTQLGIHDKPVGVLDVAGFYRPLLAFLDNTVEAGFLRPEHRANVLADDDPEALLDALSAWTPPATAKWADPTDR
ncbi:MAG: TIGR00730 family Rossman fold protein [Actinobacteria bacterium]|nr:TIGR00730 family Rossman fold protein [Actinomycetota bacterium]